MSGAVGRAGRWRWLEEYTWKAKKLENQIDIAFSRSVTEKGRQERQHFPPSLPSFRGWGCKPSLSCMLTEEQRVKVRERSYSRDLEEGQGQNRRAGVEKVQLNSSCWNNLNFLAKVRRWWSEQGVYLHTGTRGLRLT